MEVGFNSPSRKRAHFASTKGNKARKAQGRGERNHINIIDEVEYHVGAFPYPFRGHEVACRLLQPLWGRQLDPGTVGFGFSGLSPMVDVNMGVQSFHYV
eukprot:scaffold20962_cov112-Isochrysis_galbana.AAC.12